MLLAINYIHIGFPQQLSADIWGGSQRPGTRSSLICAWTNDWANNRDAGDLRRHRAHYDVIVLYKAMLLAIYLSTTHFIILSNTMCDLQAISSQKGNSTVINKVLQACQETFKKKLTMIFVWSWTKETLLSMKKKCHWKSGPGCVVKAHSLYFEITSTDCFTKVHLHAPSLWKKRWCQRLTTSCDLLYGVQMAIISRGVKAENMQLELGTQEWLLFIFWFNIDWLCWGCRSV